MCRKDERVRMNALERALIEKAGYEHGWELVIESSDNAVTLASARHPATARITGSTNGEWLLELSGERLCRELARDDTVRMVGGQSVAAADIDALARSLRRAAELAQSLPNQSLLNYEKAVREALSRPLPERTEVERTIRQRIGQDTFRAALMDYWRGACAVTGIDLPEVLRASHAKPWADCATDAERLDVFNGFLLVANLDALFDRGLISFDDSGALVTSPRLSPERRAELGLAANARLRWLAPEHTHYLAWHREKVFQPQPANNGHRGEDV